MLEQPFQPRPRARRYTRGAAGGSQHHHPAPRLVRMLWLGPQRTRTARPAPSSCDLLQGRVLVWMELPVRCARVRSVHGRFQVQWRRGPTFKSTMLPCTVASLRPRPRTPIRRGCSPIPDLNGGVRAIAQVWGRWQLRAALDAGRYWCAFPAPGEGRAAVAALPPPAPLGRPSRPPPGSGPDS